MSHWDPHLLPVPHSWDQEDEDRLAPALKVFALRNLSLKDVKAVGFDMDYTLARYRSPEIDDLAFRKALELLVGERDYPATLLKLRFDAAYAVRGLVLDGVRGNLLKVSRERQVVRASHGTRLLDRAHIELAYSHRRFVSESEGFRNIDTLFEIPEAALFAQLIDAVDAGDLPGKDYPAVFQDVRWGIDTAHRNGDIKTEILARMEDFIHQDDQLAAALDRLRRSGKKLFLATNSEWSFTHGVMSHLLDGAMDTRPRWTDYFDLIVTSTRKPRFFMEQPEPIPVPGVDHAYTEGNALWLEATLDARGEEVLYVGDHIYGDILRSKKTLSWRTLMLIPELEEELQRLEDHSGDLRELLKLETQRRRGQRRVSLLKDKLAHNRERRHVLAHKLSADALKAFDKEAHDLQAEIESVGTRTHGIRDQVRELNAGIEAAFHPLWGPIFRDGEEQTRFADQIQSYACAYTGKVSNLYMVDPDSSLYAPTPTLPHERV